MKKSSPVILFFFLIITTRLFAENIPWKFIVMGDTRDNTTATLTGISPDLSLLISAIASEKPELVIHTGDLCNGYYTDKDSPMHGKYTEMFRNWKKAVSPLHDLETNKGIPLYAVRGNHEDGKLVTNFKLKDAYMDEIARYFPQNGPEGEKGLTYSFTHKGARFLALDGYYDKKAKVIRGYVNQAWVDQELTNNKEPFIFAYSHAPAYQVGTYHESPFPDLYSHPEQRDLFWKSLNRAGAIAYFCGHIHLYCRGTINCIEQIVVGNGGADNVAYDPKNTDRKIRMHYPDKFVPVTAIGLGYLVITVDEQNGTIKGEQKVLNRKTGKWQVGDSFRLRKVMK